MSISFDPSKGLILVPAHIWGPNGSSIVILALDTGATMSVIGWNILIILGYEPTCIIERKSITTASGVEFVPKIVIERIQALEKIKTNFPILCHTLPATSTVDGVLGLDFLRGHRMSIDFVLGEVCLD